jgi:uncharacterized protein (TIGR03083 family)
MMDHVENCNALKLEIARFSDILTSLPLDQPVATCPGWTVFDLAEHLGLIHRWAEELVRLRSPVRIGRDASVAERDDVDSKWLLDGGDRLVETLLGADPDDEMWAWGLDQHVRFWSRRQLHETLVHRMDLELAAQISPRAEDAVVLDAIDEYLSNIEKVAPQSPQLSLLRGHGEALAFRVRDVETLWSVTFGEDGFNVSNAVSTFDAEIQGVPLDLLLVILRRRDIDDGSVELVGDRRLIDFWLTHSAFD